MIFSLCKSVFSIRAKDSNFVQNHLPLVALHIRYICGNAAVHSSFTVSYLINSCGLSPESALSVSKSFRLKSREKPDSVISFFKNHGFSQSQIKGLITRNPWLLSANVEKIILPKFDFFHSKGFTDRDLTKIFSINPRILSRSLDAGIIPNFNYVSDLMRSCDDNKGLAFRHFVPIFHHSLPSLLAPNVQLLFENGVPQSNIFRALTIHSRSLILDYELVKPIVEKVKKMGFNPSRSVFMHAVQVLGMSKALERKLSLYKEWGWSEEEIWSAFRKFPRLMVISDRKLKVLMDFHVKEMGWNHQHFVSRPVLLHSSLEKRVFPRCLVLKYLLSKGLIKEEDYSLVRMLSCSDMKFLEKFVIPFGDPYLSKLYAEKPALPKY